MKQVDTIYINGQFEKPHGREVLTLIDPVTEQDAAQVMLADEVDAQQAIAAASAAYRELAGSSRSLRMEWLQRLHDVVAAGGGGPDAQVVEGYRGAAGQPARRVVRVRTHATGRLPVRAPSRHRARCHGTVGRRGPDHALECQL